jgi:Gas vesicle synthesis protein GvpL/GvpF
VTTRPESETERRPAEDTHACYVYGVIPADAELPGELSGITGSKVSLVRCGELAGVVSDISPEQVLGTRDDLLAHEAVVEALAGRTTTLPIRFGAVVTTVDALVEEMLSPYHDWFTDVLKDLSGAREFAVIGVYVEEAVLREVIEEDPEVARLREHVRGLPEDAAYYDRIRLGELIVKALEDKRRADTDELVHRLQPYAAAVAVRTPADEDTAADAAFLVADEEQPDFERAVDELGERWADRIRLRLVGPLAPYDFVPPPPEPPEPPGEGT